MLTPDDFLQAIDDDFFSTKSLFDRDYPTDEDIKELAQFLKTTSISKIELDIDEKMTLDQFYLLTKAVEENRAITDISLDIYLSRNPTVTQLAQITPFFTDPRLKNIRLGMFVKGELIEQYHDIAKAIRDNSAITSLSLVSYNGSVIQATDVGLQVLAAFVLLPIAPLLLLSAFAVKTSDEHTIARVSFAMSKDIQTLLQNKPNLQNLSLRTYDAGNFEGVGSKNIAQLISTLPVTSLDLDLSENKLSNVSMGNKTSPNNTLQELTLRGEGRRAEFLYLNNLRKLNLIDLDFSKNLDSIISVINHNQSTLESFQLKSTVESFRVRTKFEDCAPEKIDELIAALNQCPRLKHIELSPLNSSAKNVSHFLQGARSIKSVETIDDYTENKIRTLINSINSNPNLRSIRLEGRLISKTEMKDLINALQNLPHFSSLEVDSLAAHRWRNITTWLKQPDCKLKSLVCNTKVFNHDFELIIKALESNTSLEFIDVYQGLSDEEKLARQTRVEEILTRHKKPQDSIKVSQTGLGLFDSGLESNDKVQEMSGEAPDLRLLANP